MVRKPNKIIQVPVNEDLLRQLDELSNSQGMSRSGVIREACARYIASAEEAALSRQYIEGYKKFPESREERDWAELGLRLLAERYADDEW
jgi:metal-responsive CopG/Arc/MetJ family transcriptional regulator